MRRSNVVAVDFDEVLHPCTRGWVGLVPDDEPPTEGAVGFLTGLLGAGLRPVVLSARCTHGQGLRGTDAWLRQYDLRQYVAEVTCVKPTAVAYVDDRAVRYDGDFVATLAAVRSLAQR